MAGFPTQLTCQKCGVHYTKTSTAHKCYLDDYLSYNEKLLERKLKAGQGPYLTVRDQRRIEFYRYLVDTNQL